MRVKCQLYFKHFTIIAYTTDYKVKRAQNQVIKSKKNIKEHPVYLVYTGHIISNCYINANNENPVLYRK